MAGQHNHPKPISSQSSFRHISTTKQFFYDKPTGAIKSFYDNKCIDMDYVSPCALRFDSGVRSALTTIQSKTAGRTPDVFYNLYLNGCNKRYNQQFIIPLVWIPDIFLSSVRLANAQQTLCWTAQTELQSNNVNMT